MNHEAPYDGYELLTTPDRVDDEAVGQLQAEFMWSRWPELARAMGIKSPSSGEGREVVG